MANIIYIIDFFYYAFSISYLYSYLMTPRKKIRKPFLTCFLTIFLVVLPLLYFLRHSDAMMSICLWAAMISALFLFQEPWLRKILCFVVAYITQVLTEAVAYFLLNSVLAFFEKGASGLALRRSMDTKLTLIMVSMIIVLGLTFTFLLAPLYKKWLHHTLTRTLVLIGLPFFLTVCGTFVWSLPIACSHAKITALLYILIYLSCYPPLFKGLQELRSQARKRALLEKQHDLMEKQFQYISKLETEYRELRKWNHDISNHLLSVCWLVEQKQYTEADSYLESILNHNFDPKNKEAANVKISNL